eukprot:5322527-Pyramimonas_sp.AAC.1
MSTAGSASTWALRLKLVPSPRKGRTVNAFSIFEIEATESEREWMDGWLEEFIRDSYTVHPRVTARGKDPTRTLKDPSRVPRLKSWGRNAPCYRRRSPAVPRDPPPLPRGSAPRRR